MDWLVDLFDRRKGLWEEFWWQSLVVLGRPCAVDRTLKSNKILLRTIQNCKKKTTTTTFSACCVFCGFRTSLGARQPTPEAFHAHTNWDCESYRHVSFARPSLSITCVLELERPPAAGAVGYRGFTWRLRQLLLIAATRGSAWSLARELVPAVENGRGPVANLSCGIVRALKRKWQEIFSLYRGMFITFILWFLRRYSGAASSPPALPY